MRLQSMPAGGSRLVRDYLAGTPRAARFYRGSPFAPGTYRRKADELDRTTGPGMREAAAPIVRPAGPGGARALREVLDRNGYFVTTGQQPGLLGGPLYSLYKALTAVRLAEDLTALLGRPVMPLFWVASEDHDWEEANHAHVIDESNRLHRLTLGPNPGAVPRPLGRIRLGEGVVEIVNRLERSFPHNDYRTRYTDLVRETFNPWATMASAFSDLMAELLRDTPVGLVDAAHPALKEASRPILRAEAEDPAASEEAVAETSDELAGLGYSLQVPVIPGAVNLLTDLEEGRDRLQRSGGGFTHRRSGRKLSKRRLMSLIEDAPGLVSPNVLLRPVVESFVFPTLAYVGGPGELAYFGQLAGLFRHHGTGMPVAVPRASLLAVETKVARVLDKFGLEVGDLRRGDALLTRFAREQVPEDAGRAVGRWRDAVHSIAEELEQISAGIDPGLAGAVKKARNAGLSALETLEKKIVRAIRRRSETAGGQIMKASVNLWPGGKPQDRVLTPLQYLMRYGADFTLAALGEARVELDSATA
ncbi:MAG: bacillithiol biosynthesis cysteine-adding enzyme BshC [Gemmatimonadota bacterium]|nr:bacillithiol biosynthesis cysteine-adding enzyme BshC [Gemmatimonadota bacterium]